MTFFRYILPGVVAVAGVLTATTANAAGDNPLIGTWEWNPIQGQCHEVHTYSADGTATSESGSERLTKTYSATKLSGGMYKVDAVVANTNGGKDCTGSPTPVGAKSTTYVMFQNYGGYLTCSSQDTMTCFGRAAPKR